jgi:hypothetical protein
LAGSRRNSSGVDEGQIGDLEHLAQLHDYFRRNAPVADRFRTQ